MRFFRVEAVNNGADVSRADVNIPKDIVRERGSGGGNFTVIFKNRTITGKKFVKASGFFLKI